MDKNLLFEKLNDCYDKDLNNSDVYINKKNGQKMLVQIKSKPFDVSALETLKLATNANLLEVYDVIDFGNEFAVLSEFSDAKSVAEIYKDGKTASAADMKNIIVSVCNALLVLNKRNIVFDGLCPENVFVLEDETVKLGGYISGNSSKLSVFDGKKLPKKVGCREVGELMNFVLTGKNDLNRIYEGKRIAGIIQKAISPKKHFQTIETVEDIKIAVMKL